MKALSRIKANWRVIQLFLLRYPIADLTIAYTLFTFGLAAVLVPHRVVHGSHFGGLGQAAGMVGLWSIACAIYLCASALRMNMKHRRRAAAMALVIMLGLTLTVDSVTGRVAWSGHTISALAIFVAVVK